jgi:hypothetical protein
MMITVGSDIYQITVEPDVAITAPRRSSRDIRRHKASVYDRPSGMRSSSSQCARSMIS